MKKFSKNSKLNALYNYIYNEYKEGEKETENGLNNDVIYIYENHMNYYLNGCGSFVYYYQLVEILKECGYKNPDKWTCKKLDDTFINATNYITYKYYKEVKSK